MDDAERDVLRTRTALSSEALVLFMVVAVLRLSDS